MGVFSGERSPGAKLGFTIFSHILGRAWILTTAEL